MNSPVDEPVKLVDHDESWPAVFAEESRRIMRDLELSPGVLEHIGSTAVPELRARPIIDMMLGAPCIPPPAEVAARLGMLGYENVGEAGVPGRLYLRRRGGEREFNLHIVERGGELWKNALALRDLLRMNSVARQRYAAVKEGALTKGHDTLQAYSADKQEIISQLVAQARTGV